MPVESLEKGGRSFTVRWLILWLLLFAASLQVVRIWNVRSNTGETPFLSANDRSRWCTILALTVNGTYAIDQVIEIRDPNTKRRTWDTIDKVRHRGPDGKQHYYSSKPPLLPTMYAGVYWLVRSTTGATLTGQTFFVVRWMLLLVNLIPLIGLWCLMLHWIRQAKLDRWQAVVLAVFALAGTFLSTFVVTLNNHLPAAVAAAISLEAMRRIVVDLDRRKRWFVLAGVAASFAAANELPALSWLVVTGFVLVVHDWRKACSCYAPALLPVAVAFMATNYWAHGTWRPAYSQRDMGAWIARVDQPAPADWTQLDLQPALQVLHSQGYAISAGAQVRPGRRSEVWELWDEESQWRFALKADPSGMHIDVYHWGDWYDYPGSYWMDGRKQGVDRGEPSPLVYAFHCTLGHHGIFSLTPFWFMAVVGGWRAWRDVKCSASGQSERWLVAAIVFTSLVVLVFYLTRPLEDRNYGGVTSGLRWIFWLAPMWFWLAVRGIAPMKKIWIRGVISVLLAISVFSAMYPWVNPWTTPWLVRWIPLSSQDSPASGAVSRYPQKSFRLVAPSAAFPIPYAHEPIWLVPSTDRSLPDAV
jgi:hypothetical protein